MVIIVKLSKTWLISAALLSALLFSGIATALYLDSDSGRIEVETVSIIEGNIKLSGLLYRPKSADAANPTAAVVLAHGIGGSKEMMSSIGLELARRGFTSLCLDLYGHGESQGTVEDGRKDQSFGVYAAVRYLKSQPFVNSSALGLLGHSLGAGAARAAAFQEADVNALVLIAGGLGEVAGGSGYGVINSTYPRNLLVIVGEYDILFDISKLAAEDLPAAFGVNQQVAPGVVYGSFSSQTARKLVIPLTTHLFEPLDPAVISESIGWMEKSLGKPQGTQGDFGNGFVYPQREASILAAFIGMLGLAVLLPHLFDSPCQKPRTEKVEAEETSNGNWRLYLVWGVVNLALFAPMFGVGLVLSFPPMIFGSSVAWWLLSSGLAGLLLSGKFSKRIAGRSLALRDVSAGAFTKKGLIMILASFAFLFATATILSTLLNFSFRIIANILSNLSSARRVLAFAAFLPFFIPYFISEGLYLHKFAQPMPNEQSIRNETRNVAGKVFGKTAPFIALLSLHYIVRIMFGIWILPSFAGFLLEFLWLILPIFAITTVFSSMFYKRTENIFPGALFNSLLMAWVASVVFPF